MVDELGWPDRGPNQNVKLKRRDKRYLARRMMTLLDVVARDAALTATVTHLEEFVDGFDMTVRIIHPSRAEPGRAYRALAPLYRIHADTLGETIRLKSGLGGKIIGWDFALPAAPIMVLIDENEMVNISADEVRYALFVKTREARDAAGDQGTPGAQGHVGSVPEGVGDPTGE